MAHVISEEEFVVVQSQLIDLKSANYSLNERCRKQANELTTLNQRLENIDNEYQKALKVISKSKKTKEVELILQENDALQLKLQSQEDEFRLQNTTLMQELTNVLNSNEQLEKQLNELQQSICLNKSSGTDVNLNNEIQKLQIENKSLKQLLNDEQQLNKSDLAAIKQKLSVISNENQCLANVNAAEDKQDDSEINALPVVESDGYELVEVSDHEVSYKKANGLSLNNDILKELQVKIEELDSKLSQSRDLQAVIDNGRVENNQLRNELERLQIALSAKSNSDNCNEEVSKLTEKLKKKQESFQQLQTEKEDMYNEHRKAIENLVITKDQEINQLKELNMRLQTQLNNAIQHFQDYKSQSARTVQELESKVNSLQSAIDGQAAERLRELEAERIVLVSKLNEAKSCSELVQKENTTAFEKIKLFSESNEQLVDKIKQLEEENTSKSSLLKTVTKTADRRKQLIDEMAVKMQTKSDEYQHDVAHLTEKYTQQINSLSRKLDDEQMRSKELETLKSRYEDLEMENKSVECTIDYLKRNLLESEEALDSTRRHYDDLLTTTQKDYDEKLDNLMKVHNQTVTELNIKLEISDTILRTEFEEKIARYQQEIKDAAEDQKIQERKKRAVIKDLKRQLQSEKKRCEAVQERLQQFMNESSQNELFKEVATADKAETGSISSWSMMSGGGHSESKESRDDSRLANESTPPPNNIYEQDNEMLVKAVTQVQQDKAELEEKLRHLELCNAAMAEDILNKSTIIQHYCMEGRSDPHGRSSVDKLTVKRVVDFIRDKGDENLKEINRRMQRMVEETLFRNVNLQKDLDAMSQEVEKLRTLVAIEHSA